MKLKNAIFPGVIFALLASSGQGTQDFQVPTFRITSSQVVVDFLAIDNQGRFVTDLRADEIQILEDGKKQSIDVFLPPAEVLEQDFEFSSRVATTGRTAAEDRTEEIRIAPAGSSAAPVRRRPLQTVILIDSRIMDANNFGHTVAAIRRFIEEHLAADHLVMMAEINRGLRIITPMTRDRATLLAGVNRLKPQSVYNPLAANADTSEIEIDQYINELQQQVFYVRDALKSLAYALSGQIGRKHVVYFSEGYPLDPLRDLEMRTRAKATEFMGNNEARMALSRLSGRQRDPGVFSMVRDVITTANRFGISFYPIDARGLVAVPAIGPAAASGDVAAGPGGIDDPQQIARAFTRDPERGPTEVMVSTFTRTIVDSLDNAQNTLVALAAGTNGTAFFNTNDLGSVLRASTAEQENYYLVSYVPSGKRKKGKFHQISVKTTRTGIHIRARKGYLDLPDKAFQQARLSAAFQHPEFFQQLAPLTQVEPSKGRIGTVIGVPAAQISFRKQGKDFHAELFFLGRIYDQDGKPVSKNLSITRGFNLNLTAEQFQGLGNQPLLARDEVKLSPGQYKLVLVVEDRLSGNLGATVQEFTVP